MGSKDGCCPSVAGSNGSAGFELAETSSIWFWVSGVFGCNCGVGGSVRVFGCNCGVGGSVRGRSICIGMKGLGGVVNSGGI